MEKLNTISESKKYLLNRNIPEESLQLLEDANIIEYYEDSVKIKMKNIEGEFTGNKVRYTDGRSSVKSKNELGSHAGFFYLPGIDMAQAVLITEGEIDRCSMISSYTACIGLSSILLLKGLVTQLINKGVPRIDILVDNDEAADRAIGSLFKQKGLDLGGVLDCRAIIAKYKDVNDFYMNEKRYLTIEEIRSKSVCLESLRKKTTLSIPQEQENRTLPHSEIAKYIIKEFDIFNVDGFLFRYDKENGLRERITKWRLGKKIIKFIEENIGVIAKSHDKNEILSLLLDQAEDGKLKEKFENVKRDENVIPLSDGIFDIKTGTLREYVKEDYMFSKFPYSSDLITGDYKEPTRWIKFLDEILEGRENREEVKSVLQEFLGSCFLSTAKFGKALLLYGSGANGKSVFCEVRREVVGIQNCTSIKMNTIHEEYNINALLGKSLNIDSDMNHNVQIDSGTIKSIICGDNMNGRGLYKDPTFFTPFAKILIATNALPTIETADNTVVRRLILTHLKQNFIGRENTNLKEELLQEKDSICAWALQGSKRLVERGKFEIPKNIQREVESFVKENDIVGMFLEEWNMEREENGFISHKDFFSNFIEFCRGNGYSITEVGRKTFGSELKKRGFRGRKNKGVRGYFYDKKVENNCNKEEEEEM